MRTLVEGLTREDRGAVTILRFARPEKKNAMTGPMLRSLIGEIGAIGEDDEVRAVVLTGTGGAFCAGADVSALRDSGDARPGDDSEAINAVEPAWWLVDCPKPVIAAVDGVAVGLGAELVAQADVRVASTRMRVAWNFVHMGLVPDTGAGTGLLPRIVGLQTALELVLSGDFVDGDRALELGLVTAVVEPDDLVDTAVTFAERLAGGSQFATSRAKSLIHASYGVNASTHIAASTDRLKECLSSQDYAEGVAAFLERRQPEFNGR